MEELGATLWKSKMPLKAAFQLLNELTLGALGKVVASLMPLYTFL